MSTNPALELAYDYVAHTDRHVFLTGKAGTGKTTFLHRVKSEVTKNMAVVAPTGVAAINAKAQTIHSLFSLPLGFIEPGVPIKRQFKISKKKLEVMRSIDLLIIDEISMVRADVLDAIDATLRSVRRKEKPFGGVQVLMIGDLHQLPPVVTSSEERVVRHHYSSSYYFGAKVMSRANPANIPLTHIYRQSDPVFIDLLNKVRHNEMDDEVLAQLNSRFQADLGPKQSEGYITLTSHNRSARRINRSKLDALPGEPCTFEAVIKDTFPESMYPNDPVLHFKVGAQVMFTRNDTTDQLYYNGKIGRITEIEGEVIAVECPGEEPIYVNPVEWENFQHGVDKSTGETSGDVVGTYTQHPLRLAWAVTIHKSQGLTFEKVIIDAADSFSHGQVYVALSRCRTFEGIVLQSKIARRSVRTDKVVSDHSAAAERNRPSRDDLAEDRKRFQVTCLEELFDFQDLKHKANEISRTLNDPQTIIQGTAIQDFMDLEKELNEHLIATATKFLPTIHNYRLREKAPEEDQAVQDRLRSAASYFTKLLTGPPGQTLRDYTYLCDNKATRAKLDEQLSALRCGYFIKQRNFEEMTAGFSVIDYTRIRTRARAEFDRRNDQVLGKKAATKTTAPTDMEHGELYEEISRWRLELSKELEIPPYTILHNKVIVSIVSVLPVTGDGLLKIRGVGKRLLEKHGDDILSMVKHYTAKQNIRGNRFDLPANSFAKSSPLQTLELYQRGLTTTEIANERALKEGTILDHAVKLVRDGLIQPVEVLGKDRFDEVEEFTNGSDLTDLGTLYVKADGTYNYAELRMVLTPSTATVA